MNINDYKGVFVFAQQVDNKVASVSLELLGRGKGIANDMNTTLTAVLMGHNNDEMAKTLIQHGADKVISVDDPMLEVYMTEPSAYALTKVIENYKPSVLLLGATAIGRDLGPRVSARVHTGLTADCTGLAIDEENGNLLMTRPAFGGNIMATIICPAFRPQMATVRPGVMQALAANADAKGEIEKFELEIPASCKNVEILEIVENKPERMNIQDANVLISGGRGMGTAENFGQLEKIADLLGGTISSSRACVDLGWTTPDRQVGQTGSTVRPNLYMACGISGQIQHLAGMEDSDLIVAINKDETAPIFNAADVGIVGDLNAILPLVEKKIAEIQAAK
ncbi:MAG: electron transfer flavoprotein subunit alpha/FixB family protein [Oscillospiraceae bacterium]|nr:electron transfer flavoprotein subunit alpha/FixB family protein [Oscillospiraceae bacterium]